MAFEIGASDYSLLKRLTDVPGLPGREKQVVDVIKHALPEQNWDVKTDPLGNLTAHKPANGRKLLFIAHTDEVGLIVRRITPEGFLQVERLGGIGTKVLQGSAFDLWTDEGRLDAMVGCLAAHLEHGQAGSPSLEEMYVDVGAGSKDETLSLGINVGDGLTWKPGFCQLPGKRVRSKALDDRLGCFALIRLAEALNDSDVDYDITLAFVGQEESMILESGPVVRAVDPEIVIGIDGTLTFDTPETLAPQNDIAIGSGPAIKLMDAIRGKTAYLPDWDLSKKFITFSKNMGLPLQREVVVNISNALSLVPFMNQGIKTACLSIPIRYHHSAVEVADLVDLETLVNGLMVMVSEDIL